MKRPLRQLMRLHPGVRFAIVGGTGFAVDTTVIFVLLEGLHVELAVARMLAFFCAASSNWFLNRHFTFAERMRVDGKSAQWMRFVASAMLSAVPNLGLFFLLMHFLPETPLSILSAMCCGILAGYFCNYLLARAWVFRLEAR